MLDSREAVTTFGHKKVHFQEASLVGGILLIYFWTKELVVNLPALFRLRSFYKAYRKKNFKNSGPRIVVYSDNLDEMNGISINARSVIGHLQKQGKEIYLVGTSFHTKGYGLREKSGAILAPQNYTMEQVGYKGSELTIPSLKHLILWARRYPVDLVEIETPAPGGMLAMIMGRFAGVKVISHYRTDIMAYSATLVKSRAVRVLIQYWVMVFNRVTTPIIVPSTWFENKIREEAKLQPKDVVLVERGIPLENYGPKKAKGLWSQFFETEGSSKFLFVGRVSREKELEFMLKVWRKVIEKEPDAQWLVVGAGPFLDEMKDQTQNLKGIAFAGRRQGEELSSLYAEADCFLFPSGTDTFGNVVVEALASGTPAIVSDRGGPLDIVHGMSGSVLKWANQEIWETEIIDWIAQIKSSTPIWEERIQAALHRSKFYSLDLSASRFWEFHLKTLGYTVK